MVCVPSSPLSTPPVSPRRARPDGPSVCHVAPADAGPPGAGATEGAPSTPTSSGSNGAACVHLPEAPDPELGDADRAIASLTDREREALVSMANGLSNAEIAQPPLVSRATVESHGGRILGKLCLRDWVQAVVFAFQTGIVHRQGHDSTSTA
jgi:DNA-binding CsgD family transcriptional regulator